MYINSSSKMLGRKDSHSFNYLNQLTEIIKSNNTRTVYRYDPLGRRISKRSLDQHGCQKEFGGMTISQILYFSDGSSELEEYTTDNALQKKFIYGIMIDEVLTIDVSGSRYYYHDTSLGSVAAITNSSELLQESYKFDVYGDDKIFNSLNLQISSSLINNPLRFTSRRKDFEENSSLYNYKARYYRPETGRYLQRDPLGPWADILNLGNGYTFTANNPCNFLDFFGLKTYVAMYYTGDKDKSFQKAARTWKKEVESRLSFDPICDIVLLYPVLTEEDFRESWVKISLEVSIMELAKNLFPILKKCDFGIHDLRLFIHATESTKPDKGGLEFRPRSGGLDGTLTRGETGDLIKLPWGKDSSMTLHGCDTGMCPQGGISLAQAFATKQGVTTYGERGYSYFSEIEERYQEITEKSKNIYLHAYYRARNIPWYAYIGWGFAMDFQKRMRQESFKQ